MVYSPTRHKIAWRICKRTFYNQIKFGLIAIKFTTYYFTDTYEDYIN